MNISIVAETELQQGVLAGSLSGRRLLARLIAIPVDDVEPQLCLLDFAGIEVATASFLRESVLAFRSYCRTNRPTLYPIVVNAAPAVAEELNDLLTGQGDAIASGRLGPDGSISDARLLGALEEKQRQTLDAISHAGSAAAADLAQIYPDSGIGATAWNNRLSSLATKGILMEERRGRAKVYRTVVKGL